MQEIATFISIGGAAVVVSASSNSFGKAVCMGCGDGRGKVALTILDNARDWANRHAAGCRAVDRGPESHG